MKSLALRDPYDHSAGHDRPCTFEPPLWNHNNLYRKTTSHTHVSRWKIYDVATITYTRHATIVSTITNTWSQFSGFCDYLMLNLTWTWRSCNIEVINQHDHHLKELIFSKHLFHDSWNNFMIIWFHQIKHKCRETFWGKKKKKKKQQQQHHHHHKRKIHNFIIVIYSLAEGEKTKSESTTCTKLWIMMNHLKERALQRIHNWGVDELQPDKPPNLIRKEWKTKSWLQGLVECMPLSRCIMSLSWLK
jgi:hypothetical protein